MAEVLRCMELRGDDLQTNAPVHYGLINWFLGKGPMAEPDTRFMASYLAAVGALAQLARDVDLELAASEMMRGLRDDEARAAFADKQTLLVRPLQRLLANAHVLGGFLGRFEGLLWTTRNDEPVFADNPIRFLRELYHYLQMEENPDTPPARRSGPTTRSSSTRRRRSTPRSRGAPARAGRISTRCSRVRATRGSPTATRSGERARLHTAAISSGSSSCS
jgi:hypothetical protein